MKLVATLLALASPLGAQQHFVQFSAQARIALTNAWIENVRQPHARMASVFYCAYVHVEEVAQPTPVIPFLLVVDSAQLSTDVGCEAVGANAIFGFIDGTQFEYADVAAAMDAAMDEAPPSQLAVAVVVGLDLDVPQTVGSLRRDRVHAPGRDPAPAPVSHAPTRRVDAAEPR